MICMCMLLGFVDCVQGLWCLMVVIGLRVLGCWFLLIPWWHLLVCGTVFRSWLLLDFYLCVNLGLVFDELMW